MKTPWQQRDQGLAGHLPGDQGQPGDRGHEQLAGEVVLPVLDDRDHARRRGLEQAGREHPGERERHRVQAGDPADGGLQDRAQAADEQDRERQVDRQPGTVAQQLDHVALGDDQQRGQLVRRPPRRVGAGRLAGALLVQAAPRPSARS